MGIEKEQPNEHPLAKWRIQAIFSEEKFISKAQAQRSSEEAFSLEVRMEVLIEFLSKGVSRSSSLFKVHNGGTREISYQWSIEAETAFQK